MRIRQDSSNIGRTLSITATSVGEDYAFEAGIHRTYVSDIERGARNPTATIIEKLAKPFGIAPGRLLD